MDVDVLKLKVIKDFHKYFRDLTRGYQKDPSIIINTIQFIENQEDLLNTETISQYLINIKYE